MRCFCLAHLVGASYLFSQTPQISPGGILNHFSYALPGMPNASIAQGSIFDIYGIELGPDVLVSASGYPLPTTIANISAQVIMGSTTVDLYLFFVSKNQIVALLPSRTPIGTGTVIVTRNGIRGAGQSITVAARNIGLLTLAQNGRGPAVMQLADSSGNVTLNSATNSAFPGQVGVFYGTGLGPVTFDERSGAQAGNVGTAPIAMIGDRPARVLYSGRAPGFAGLDQVNIEIPQGVSGCNLTFYLRYGNLISNLSTLSVGQTAQCSDPVDPNPPPSVPTNGLLRVAGLQLIRTIVIIPANAISPETELTTDVAAAAFSVTDLSKIPPGVAQTSASTRIGPCFVGALVNTEPGPSNDAVTFLDGGNTMTVRGPSETKTLDKQPTGFGAILGMTPIGPSPILPPPFLSPGVYTVANGSGSSQVPAFSASITFPNPEFSWTNKSTATISRASGFEVTWSGGDSTGWVDVAGSSTLARSAAQPVTSGGFFSCRVRANLGRLTIPAEVLLFLPPSTATSPGSILVSNTFTSVSIPLPDFYQSQLDGAIGISRSVQFQ